MTSSNARRDDETYPGPQSDGRWRAGALAFALILASGAAPAAAKSNIAHRLDHKPTERASKEPFGNIPKGPLQIFVSIDQQKLHLYSDGAHVADTSIATGVPSLPTPLGVFSVIQKQVFHRSNIYSNAPMPYMQRITWSGVALHEGESIGHRASHGCIRMPRDFAVRLYSLTRMGARVIIANPELKPAEFADPHLFVHKDKPPETEKPPEQVAAPAPAQALKTVADASKTNDAMPADPTLPLQPTALGLRVSTDTPAAADAKLPMSNPSGQNGEAPAAAAPTAPAVAAPVAAAPDDAVPVPPAKPADIAKDVPTKKTPIAIFISRKEKKIYVRQDFEPLFDAPVTFEQPDRPLGTHVFTAMNFLDDHATLRWTVVSLPGEPPKPVRNAEGDRRGARYARDGRRDERREKAIGNSPPPQTPEQALARIDIPQSAIDYISQLIVPGSSLIVSDQGLGDETGEGTDFIVVTR